MGYLEIFSKATGFYAVPPAPAQINPLPKKVDDTTRFNYESGGIGLPKNIYYL